jgi:CrcB protein
MKTFWIAIFGVVGVLGRYEFQNWGKAWVGGAFPIGTLLINILGSFAIGLIATGKISGHALPETIRLSLMVGLLGGFTTFSTFSLDTINLFRNGSFLIATLYVLSSVFLCLAATTMAFKLTGQL